MASDPKLMIFSGSSNPGLAHKICEFLDTPMGKCRLERFSDGELFVEIGDNVRNTDVYIVQSTSLPVNEHLMELLIMIDALKRASASSICAVIPYYGYARQDRKVAPRTPITAKLVCDLLTAAGATRVLSVDLHAGQIQGFFNIPFDHLFAMPILLDHLQASHHKTEDIVVVSPDAGGVERARAFAKRMDTGLAIIDKRRPAPNVAKIMNIIGEVKDRHAVLIDDMIDTAGTIVEGAKALMEHGAARVSVYASHGVLSGKAIERIEASPIAQVIVTDTVPLRLDGKSCTKIVQLSAAPLLAKAMRRIHQGKSVSSLFV